MSYVSEQFRVVLRTTEQQISPLIVQFAAITIHRCKRSIRVSLNDLVDDLTRIGYPSIQTGVRYSQLPHHQREWSDITIVGNTDRE